MQYWMHDLCRSAASPVNSYLEAAHFLASHRKNPLSRLWPVRLTSAVLESTSRLIKEYPKPDYNFQDIEVNGRHYPVTESVISEKPFCHLRKFCRKGLPQNAPKVFFIAPLSGHYASLSRKAYFEFLGDHEVYVSDWLNARDVPLSEGRFGLDEYIDYIIEFLAIIPGNCHIVAVSQSTVPALVATAHMSKEQNSNRPKSVTLIAGPIDTTVNSHPAIWATSPALKITRKLLLSKVSSDHPGAGREVIPGLTQWTNFTAMGGLNYVLKHLLFFKDAALGNDEAVTKHREFYDEYMSVLDIDSKLYNDSLDRVFFDQPLLRGEMTYHNRTVDCNTITDVPLFTIEGKDDTLVPPGQTEAAHHLCGGLPNDLKEHHLQPGTGHIGIFHGSTFNRELAPRIKQFIQQHS